jgi:hypothetical protein
VATSLSSLFSKEGLLMKMNLFEWFKRLFKRKKSTCIVTSTAQYRYKHFSIKPTTTEEKYVKFPITHPAKYKKFFKKKRQPTTARKLWKPRAKIEDA